MAAVCRLAPLLLLLLLVLFAAQAVVGRRRRCLSRGLLASRRAKGGSDTGRPLSKQGGGDLHSGLDAASTMTDVKKLTLALALKDDEFKTLKAQMEGEINVLIAREEATNVTHSQQMSDLTARLASCLLSQPVVDPRVVIEFVEDFYMSHDIRFKRSTSSRVEKWKEFLDDESAPGRLSMTLAHFNVHIPELLDNTGIARLISDIHEDCSEIPPCTSRRIDLARTAEAMTCIARAISLFYVVPSSPNSFSIRWFFSHEFLTLYMPSSRTALPTSTACPTSNEIDNPARAD